MDYQERTVGQYIIGDTLGKGGYSWVKHGTDKNNGEVVALKFMVRADSAWEQEQANQVRTEIKSMIKIKSDYVMKLYAYNLNAKYPQKDGKPLNCILLVLEYCPGGELFDILYYCQQLDEKTARTYFRQMVQGLEDCHKNGVIHRDIKPQNLLMDSEYQLKITDFGLSKLLKDVSNPDELMKTSYVGTRGFQAPCLLKKEKYTRACDIFSAGVVLFILLTGYPPFNHARKDDQWYRPLAKGDTKAFWKQHKGCGVPDACKSLIESMLCYRASKRITIDEIRNHPWFNGPVHSAGNLKKVLREKHEIARAKRRKDPRKIEDYRNSVKIKRDIASDEKKTFDEMLKAWGEVPAASRVDFGLFSWDVPKVSPKGEKIDPMEALSHIYGFFTHAKQWVNAKVDKLDGDEKWLMRVNFKDTKEREFTMRVNVVASKDSYTYTFTKVKGETFAWHKIWGEIELYILKMGIFDVEKIVEKSPISSERKEEGDGGDEKVEETVPDETDAKVPT